LYQSILSGLLIGLKGEVTGSSGIYSNIRLLLNVHLIFLYFAVLGTAASKGVTVISSRNLGVI